MSHLTRRSVLLAAIASLLVTACAGTDPGALPNKPPTITSMKATPAQVRPGETTRLEVTASDSDGEDLTWNWSASGDWTAEGSDRAPGTATVTAPDTYTATGEITVEVVDDEGARAEETLELTTPANNGPYIASLTVDPREVPKGGSADLVANASDPESRTLTYEWSVESAEWTLEFDGNEATIEAPDKKGESTTIEVNAQDPGGASATATMVISTVKNSAPVISTLNAHPTRVIPEETTTVSASANDPDGDDLSFAWTLPDDWSHDGSGARIDVTGPGEYERTGLVQLVVTDDNGGRAEAVLQVSTEQNRAPTVASMLATPQRVRPGGATTITANASDPLDDELSYEWTLPSGWSTDDSGPTIAVDAPDAYGETDDIQLVVKDGHGKQATGSVPVTTGENRDPIVNSLTANPSSVGIDGLITVTARASDPNGDSVDYNWKIPQNWTRTSGGGNQVEIQAPGQYDVTGTLGVTVEDGYGGETIDSIEVHTSRNQAPLVRSLSSSDLILDRQTTAGLTVSADDPNGDELSYDWDIQGNGWSITEKTAPSGATVTAPDIPDGKALVTVTVSDDHGQATEATQNLQTEANNPPRILTPSSNLSLPDRSNPSPLSHSRTATYQVEASDRDGDDLNYSLTTSTNASIDSDGLIAWTPTRAEKGTHTITLEVDDGYDTETRSMTFEVGDLALEGSETRRLESGRKAFAWADVDGDGWTDGIYNDPDSFGPRANIRVARGSKHGFESPKSYDIASNGSDWQYCDGFAAGDLDGDGHPDVMTACEQGAYNSDYGSDTDYAIWMNDGTGDFSLGNTGTWSLTDTYVVNDLDLGDFDNDGDLDAAVSSGDHLVVAENDGNANFVTSDNVHEPDDLSNDISTEFVDIATGDIMGGAQDEVVVTYERRYNPAEIAVYDVDSSFNLGARKQTYSLPSGSETPFSLALADLDTDGDLDATFLDDATDTLYILENDSGTLKFSDQNRFSGVSTSYYVQGERRTVVDDFDGDGSPDIATAFSGLSHDIAILLGDGNAGIDTTSEFYLDSPYSNTVRALHATDWDGNGERDLLLGTSDRLGIAY